MSIVKQTIELLKLSYHADIYTAYNAECEIYVNFDKMTEEEKSQYRIEAQDVAKEYEN